MKLFSEKRQYHCKKVLVILTIMFIIFTFCFFECKIFRMPSLFLQDTFFSLIFGRLKANDSVLVLVDRESLLEIGSWPPSRIVHAEVHRNLRDAGAKLVAWDMLFLGDDSYSLKKIEKFYKKFFNYDINLKNEVIQDTDIYFLQELRKNGIIGHFNEQNKNPMYEEDNRYLEIQQGHIMAVAESDGVIRSSHLAFFDDGQVYPLLGAYAAMIVTGQTNAINEGFKSKNRYHSLIDSIYFRHWETDILSYIKVFENNFDPNLVKDKVVFIGAGDPSLNDIKHFSWGWAPGVYNHLNVFEDLIHGTVDVKNKNFTIVLGIILSLSFFFILYSVSYKKIIYVYFISLPFLVLSFFGYCVSEMVYVDCIPSLIAITAITIALVLFGMFEEHKHILRIQRYVAPEIATMIIESDKKEVYMEGIEKDITILFTDLRNFTKISDSLSPKQVQILLNYMFTPMSKIIRENKGIVDKYIGDAIMAFWNAPFDVPMHHEKALEAAFAIQNCIHSVEDRLPFTLPDGLHLRCGIGINAGPAYIGDMGAKNACSYTCLGKTVNIASRIEHLCSELSVNLLVTESFKMRFDYWSKYRFLLLDVTFVKGIRYPQLVYQPVLFDNSDPDGQFAIEQWIRMEQALRNGTITKAAEIGERAIKNGYFEKKFKQDSPSTTKIFPQKYFLENIERCYRNIHFEN